MPDEPDIKQENLADTDDSPLGTTDEHAGEQDTEQGETYADPEGDERGAEDRGGALPLDRERHERERRRGRGQPSPCAPPESERLANRDGRLTSRARGHCSTRTTLLLMFRGAPGRLGRVNGTASGVGHPAWIPAPHPTVRPPPGPTRSRRRPTPDPRPIPPDPTPPDDLT